MSNFPSVKAKEFIRVIEKLGFHFDRQKGSHAIYKNIQGKRVVVPIHSGKDIKHGTLMGMIQDIDVDKETFFTVFLPFFKVMHTHPRLRQGKGQKHAHRVHRD